MNKKRQQSNRSIIVQLIYFLTVLLSFYGHQISYAMEKVNTQQNDCFQLKGDDINLHLVFAIYTMDPVYVASCLMKKADPSKAFDDDNNNGIHLLLRSTHTSNLRKVAELVMPYARNCFFQKNKKGKTPFHYFKSKKHAVIKDIISNQCLVMAIAQMDLFSIRKSLSRASEPAKACDHENNNGIHLLFMSEPTSNLPDVAKLILPYAGNCWYKENNQGKLPLDYFDPEKKHSSISDLVIDIAHYYSWQKYGKIVNKNHEPLSQKKRLASIRQLMTSQSDLYKSNIKEIECIRSNPIDAFGDINK